MSTEGLQVQKAVFGEDVLVPWVVLARVGSDSHGTKITPANGGIDDTDYMGVIFPGKKAIVGLDIWEGLNHGPDEQGLDVTIYSIKKFVSLLLKQNPNVMGLLWLREQDYVLRSDTFQRLLILRESFASKKAYESFIGYAHSQLHRMENMAYRGYMGEKRKHLVDQFGYDTKNAAHLIRLLRMGIEFLETGNMRVHRGGLDAQELIDIKQGKWKLADVKDQSRKLFEEAAGALGRSKLPAEPDYAVAERFLMDEQLRYLEKKT